MCPQAVFRGALQDCKCSSRLMQAKLSSVRSMDCAGQTNLPCKLVVLQQLLQVNFYTKTSAIATYGGAL